MMHYYYISFNKKNLLKISYFITKLTWYFPLLKKERERERKKRKEKNEKTKRLEDKILHVLKYN